MGLLSDMELSPIRPNAVQRALQRLGATRIGTAILSSLMRPFDRMSYKLSGGRTTVGRALGALPVVMLKTVGARSGQLRVHPLSAIPYEGDVALVGTNFGRGRTPAWAHNLRATPDATVTYEDRDFSVVATEIDKAEHDNVFASAISIYPGYARYRKIATNEIPIFLLKAKGSE